MEKDYSLMKIRSTVELEDYLDKEMSWRKKEMSLAISNYLSAKERTKDHYSRVAILTIYSHWEGFIKKCAEAYLIYLNSQSIQCKDININFLSSTLMKETENNTSIKKISNRKIVIDFLAGDLTKKFSADISQIDADSNLKIEILEGICYLVGIDNSAFIQKKVWVDERLLAYRNKIAHGERILDSSIGFNIKELKDEIQNLLELFKNNILNAVSTKNYLKQGPIDT